ncbi:hypothetical protein HRbin35_00059 [bacterium HR35]|nr:hypothetical protein HRbin35_00059 [bacterium HR35]
MSIPEGKLPISMFFVLFAEIIKLAVFVSSSLTSIENGSILQEILSGF